jgi:hypothetical protein
MCGFIRRRPGEELGPIYTPLRISRRCSASANNVARSCDCNMAFRRGDDLVRGREKFTTQPRTHRLCLGPGNMIIMQIFIYRFTDASHGKIDGSDVAGGAGRS